LANSPRVSWVVDIVGVAVRRKRESVDEEVETLARCTTKSSVKVDFVTESPSRRSADEPPPSRHSAAILMVDEIEVKGRCRVVALGSPATV
jgi:hypothetical protein